MRVSAKSDYAIRAAVELAAAGDGPVKGDRIAKSQSIPSNFLENILADLRNAGIVSSRRGAEGGYWLARPADEVSLADVIRAVDGPLANVRGVRSDQLEYEGSAKALAEVWIADGGPGLPNTGNLFVPFFTTKPQGSGIGLVLSRQIAEAHGGSLPLSMRVIRHRRRDMGMPQAMTGL